MDGHSYSDENYYIYPDTSDYNIGNNELVFKFPPHDNYEGVDRDGLISQATLSTSIYQWSYTYQSSHCDTCFA